MSKLNPTTNPVTATGCDISKTIEEPQATGPALNFKTPRLFFD
jgi:hypothetical protein